MNRVCYDHRTLTTPPRGCPTCTRINIEADIVEKTVDVLLGAGYALATDAEADYHPTTDRATVLAALMTCDDEFLAVWKAGSSHADLPDSWVRFVYGNDGWDVICDYAMSLEPILRPVEAYVDTLTGDAQ